MYRVKEGDKEGVVFLDKEDLFGDVNTMRQIRRMIKDPTVDHARIMPDCHFGQGCCVGFTSRLTDKIVPRFIGGDIGCGMMVHPVSRHKEHGEKLDVKAKQMRDRIPVGDAMHPEGTENAEAMEAVYKEANELAHKFGQAWRYDDEYLDALCRRIRIAEDRVRRQLGTLGGGNHFLELGTVDADALPPHMDGMYYATVHSGSRGLGQAVCRFHQDVVTARTKGDHRGYEKEVRKMEKRIKDKKQRKEADDALRAKYLEPKGAPYLEGDEAMAYYRDMIFTQSYARINRWVMLTEMMEVTRFPVDPEKMMESVHNYIDFEDRVWRKGAVRAHKGQPVIVALNMRDGIAIGVGEGDLEWNQSAPHGAGRRIPRGEARLHTSMGEFRKAMEGVPAATVIPETLDESPAMYKDGEFVLDKSVATFRVTERVRPVLNIKGYERSKK